jgi:hypothetical protein
MKGKIKYIICAIWAVLLAVLIISTIFFPGSSEIGAAIIPIIVKTAGIFCLIISVVIGLVSIDACYR